MCAVDQAGITKSTSLFRLPATWASMKLSERKLIDIDEEEEIDIVL